VSAEAAPGGPIAIVGTVVDDRILLPDGSEARGLGGLVYGVAELVRASDGRRPILPICRADREHAARLAELWGRFEMVELGGIVPGSDPCTRVELDYRAPGLTAGERVERLLDPVTPLDPEELCSRAAGASAVLVNMITGFDVEIGAFRAIPSGPCVMLDVHSLALARDRDGLRSPRSVPEPDAWLGGADIVQCNRQEAAMLTGADSALPVDRLAERLASALREAHRPRLAVLTLGVEGAVIVPAEGDPLHRPAPRVVRGDPTGAGDTLGAAFLAHTIDGAGPLEALDRAMAAAASACERSGTGPT
jgi:hypothetical protein